MKMILFVLGMLACLAGFAFLASAKSAIHEIEGLILLLMCAVFVTGSAIVEAVNRTAAKR